MEKPSVKAMRIAIVITAIMFFLYTFISWQDAIVGGLFFWGVSFCILRSIFYRRVEFLWWQWIFYILGWVYGLGNLIFWLIMYQFWLLRDYGEPFFNKKFHRRVYVWGFYVTIIISIFAAAVLISLLI